MACSGGLIYEGHSKAVSEAVNDVLIAEYCEAADEETLSLLQKVGGAAMGFLKLCHLAGWLSDWQFNNNVSLLIQWRVIGYHRDHSRSRIPGGVYGSRMTDMLAHRYIDSAIYVGVVTASMGTGEQLTKKQFVELSEACAYINDLIDFRSDTMRKQREDVILRGVRGNLCRYLDESISACITAATRAIRSSRVSALVVMGICNWMVMASQHKTYEVVLGVKERETPSKCHYESSATKYYQDLLSSLAGYGTLGDEGPIVTKRRADMDTSFHSYRSSPQSHISWLADSTRTLLDPVTLRKLIDVVHFEWKGDTGDVEYCP